MTCGGDSSAGGLLSLGDPDPIVKLNPKARSSFLLLGDHAGTACPARLGDLGVRPEDWARHIACDFGTGALGRELAQALDAPFITQAYSRLVIDCNRDPVHPEAIPQASDGTDIPGNRELTADDRDRRIAEIHAPYHRAIADQMRQADADGPPLIVVSLHSFTPVWHGQRRPWRAGVLYGGGIDSFATGTLALLREELGDEVGDNQPYAFDGTDYTVPRHAIEGERPYVELEIRQDGLHSAAGIAEWSERLAWVLTKALTKASSK